MRIGILTLPLHTNYGGILQAYALQTVLERMGHDVCLIEKRRTPAQLPLWKIPWAYGKRIVKNIIGHPFPIFYEQKINREDPIIKQNTDLFIHKYIKRRIIDDFSEIREHDYNAIIVGSDQIWRPIYFDNKTGRTYLDFTKDWKIKRIAYAASFGTDKWEYSFRQTRQCKRLIQHFDAVSMREDSGVDLCRKHFGVEAQHVLDPTMLLNKEDYIRLFEKANVPKSKGNMLCYILDETQKRTYLVNKIAAAKGLIPFRVNSKEGNINAPLQERIQPPVEQWLRGFYDAEFVVTDSFHTCAFSILFNKPFLAIGNASRGMSRFNSLLSMFGLEKQLTSGKSYDMKELENVDWSKINTILNEQINMSAKFLTNNLAE